MKPISEDREQGVLDLLNGAISILAPIHYDDINVVLNAKDEQALINLEKTDEKLGITIRNNKTVMTVLSLIATITDVLCDKRLAFQFDDDMNIVGVQWYEPISVPE